MSARRVLVTGGAGFIGSHVADAYLARGDEVWIIDDLSSGREDNLPAGARFIELGIGDRGVDELFQEVGGFDLINHHAAQIDVRHSVADPRHDAAINIDGLLNLLECARKYGTERFIFVSSGGVVYGEPEVRPTPETAPKLPMSPYGVSKLTAEYYLAYYQQIHGLEYVALRYSNVYGPRQDPFGEAGVVAIFSTRLLDQEPLTIYGDGEQTRDYIYVGDVVSANILLSEQEFGSFATLDDRAFNVGTGIETSVNELARTLMQSVGTSVDLIYTDPRPGELRHSALETKKLREIGWEPETSLLDGLAATYEHIAGERVSR